MFATKNSELSHCFGWHYVADVCKGAKIYLPVNATQRRHRLSTIYSSLDMSAKDRKVFLDHMGHGEAIMKNYLCPPGVNTVLVMGKMLSNANKGVSYECTITINTYYCAFYDEPRFHKKI